MLRIQHGNRRGRWIGDGIYHTTKMLTWAAKYTAGLIGVITAVAGTIFPVSAPGLYAVSMAAFTAMGSFGVADLMVVCAGHEAGTISQEEYLDELSSLGIDLPGGTASDAASWAWDTVMGLLLQDHANALPEDKAKIRQAIDGMNEIDKTKLSKPTIPFKIGLEIVVPPAGPNSGFTYPSPSPADQGLNSTLWSPGKDDWRNGENVDPFHVDPLMHDLDRIDVFQHGIFNLDGNRFAAPSWVDGCGGGLVMDCYGDGIDGLSSLGATPTDWGSDPSLASIMKGPEITTAGDFAACQLNVDIAVASLQFGSETCEQVCDITGSAATASNLYTMSTSAESATGSFFSEEQRQSA